uniref:Uncharacterized protein n=2 Tax=Emiliania huxleyi TaxID=2903 RepID=A0A7S3SRY4_EMIHU
MMVMPENSKKTLVNSPSNGVWTSHLKLPHFRVLNQTRRCKGPQITVFSEPLSDLVLSRHGEEILMLEPGCFRAIPPEWQRKTHPASLEHCINFELAHGTLVRHHTLPLSLSPSQP